MRDVAHRELEREDGRVQDDLAAAIDRAEQAREALERELEELRAAGDERWDVARTRLFAALREMQEAGRRIGAALSEQGAGDAGDES